MPNRLAVKVQPLGRPIKVLLHPEATAPAWGRWHKAGHEDQPLSPAPITEAHRGREAVVPGGMPRRESARLTNAPHVYTLCRGILPASARIIWATMARPFGYVAEDDIFKSSNFLAWFRICRVGSDTIIDVKEEP